MKLRSSWLLLPGALLVLFALATGAKVDPDAFPRIVSRDEWGARKPVLAPVKLPHSPAPYVVVHHGGIPEYCFDQTRCSEIVRSYQNLHMDVRKWNDIGYNFVIGEDGNIYEGRGWDYVGAHAPGYNTQSIGVSIIGDFSEILPDEAALGALGRLIDLGLLFEKIGKDYKIIGHRQARDTLCPGDALYRHVTKLPAWTPDPTPTSSNKSSPSNSLRRVEWGVEENRVGESPTGAGAIWPGVRFRPSHRSRLRICLSPLEGTRDVIFSRPEIMSLKAVTALLALIFLSEPRTVRVEFVTRAEWGARTAVGPVDDFPSQPLYTVVIHHSDTRNCTGFADCKKLVKSIQNYHIDEKHWFDIGYNFLVGDDGIIFEGRGWDKQGAHARSHNADTIGICFLGRYNVYYPKQSAVKAAKDFVSEGVNLGKLYDNYTVIGHRDVGKTTCPGDRLFGIVQTWRNTDI
ncbi:uncharacterized protein LOC105700745 [Orussus abietinus]|uniref:uncharacterized protein LOC105700745 n=1 Tax=Orussus abietinus TaxID=222816 RepID=UPI00062662B9|nr:uncharacterized protein LOC105700745 [Orussus abietinus]